MKVKYTEAKYGDEISIRLADGKLVSIKLNDAIEVTADEGASLIETGAFVEVTDKKSSK